LLPFPSLLLLLLLPLLQLLLLLMTMLTPPPLCFLSEMSGRRPEEAPERG
jgi:hypothetical protein